MQLKSLYIKDYKILKDFSIDFPYDFKRYISVFIGANGSGKSTILEAIITIFSSVLLKEKAKFGFELEYSVRHNELIEQTSTTSEFHTEYLMVKLSAKDKGDKIHLNVSNARSSKLYDGEILEKEKMVIVLSESHKKYSFTVLPENIIVYYSGLSEILEELCKPHEAKLSKAYRKGNTNLNRDFFYFKPEHYGIILTSLLSFEYGDIPEFLKTKSKIAGVQSIQIRLQKPDWASDSIENFWGAKGDVRKFLNYLDSLSEVKSLVDYLDSNIPGSNGVVIEAIDNVSIVISLLGINTLYKVREFLIEERKLFETLNIMLADGILKDISFSLIKEEQENLSYFNVLSEGEQQSIIIKGLTELLSEKNSLFLFDEPDTYLHPKWQRQFITDIESTINEKYDSENSFVIATHSPQLLSNAKSDLNFVKIMEEGSLIENTPKYYGREISSILYDLMGVEERNIVIREYISNLFTSIEEEEIEEAERMLIDLQNLIGVDDPELKRAEIQISYLKEDQE